MFPGLSNGGGDDQAAGGDGGGGLAKRKPRLTPSTEDDEADAVVSPIVSVLFSSILKRELGVYYSFNHI